MKKKYLALFLAIAITVGCLVGGTVAWLIANTDSVVNTFTAGNINITLTETENLDLKMVPGQDITKDPKVTVEGGSESCWLFVRAEKSPNFSIFFPEELSVEEGWTPGTGTGEGENGVPVGVYFRQVTASENDQPFYVLKDNKLTVNNTVCKYDMDTLDSNPLDRNPTLTFTAYAMQLQKTSTTQWSVAEAWDQITGTPS